MNVLTNLIVLTMLKYIYQIITLYTLNLHTVIYQLYLNKTGRKKQNAPPPKKTGVFEMIRDGTVNIIF